MAAITILAARRDIALDSIDQRLQRMGEALGVEFPSREFPKLRDELHRTTFQVEWFDSVLGAIEKEFFEEGKDEVEING